MLGVLPFIEDPDLSCTAGTVVPQHLPPCVGVNLGAICHIGLGDAGKITITITDLILLMLAIFGSILLLTLLICLACFCYRRSIHSRSVKKDINNDYGIYPESGDVVMEVVDKNTEYEHQPTGGKETSDYDNMYNKMG